MDIQNEQNSLQNRANAAQGDDQTKASTSSTNPPADTDDMELNEEQLDIISGGGDVTVILKG